MLLNRLGDGCRFFRRARLSIFWFSFSAFCFLKAVDLAALQAFSIPPHCLFGGHGLANSLASAVFQRRTTVKFAKFPAKIAVVFKAAPLGNAYNGNVYRSQKRGGARQAVLYEVAYR